ncbi:hypothetical protein EFN43_09230 [Pediococcus pentosaceus]|uniref:hypothetical protein n=1 Tax=Pediococcus pentosaceus TaxID=1255 RepID=UPI0021A84515|nr:hypothetical protein [Pediococcus pentosaceus]MCT3021240.1 hypothetical protein [Pediococcus pentosaceus]
MLFYDFEVFVEDWMVVIMDSDSHSTNIIVNDTKKFIDFYHQHDSDIWVGYNSRHYDQYIAKAIIAGFEPQEMNDWIIEENKMGWQFSRSLFKIQFYNFDIMTQRGQSLKQLEGFMGDSVEETSVDFTINRKLTDEEIEEVIHYCTHDVEETINVFMARQEEFQTTIGLVNEFNLPIKYVTKTKAQLSAIILEAKQPESERDDEMDISFPDTLDIHKYADVKTFYENTRDYEQTYTKEIAGVKHIFAWGGLHGAKENYHGKGTIINVDVGSYYPTIMIRYGYTSRNIRDPQKYANIRKTRLEYKKQGDPRQGPYKIVLNSTYGAMKDKYNGLYDPRQANNVCVGGMLLLLDLIEKLEPYVELVQSNTDGLYIRLLDDDDFDTIDDICYEWETRTGMGLDFHYFDEVFQKDVNNYIMIDRESGTVKTKGAYVKKLSDLDYDLPIVNKALVDYFVEGTPIEETINECNDLRQFQRVVKLSYKFDGASLGNQRIQGKVQRVFASKNQSAARLYKVKQGHLEKISYTPEHVFIDNGNVSNKKIPTELDRGWYIRLAKTRAKNFGGF